MFYGKHRSQKYDFSFVVAMAMEKLRVEVNWVNDIKTYLEEDP